MQVVKKDGVTYDGKYFAMSAPESWNVVYNLKAKLGKDKYRIQFKAHTRHGSRPAGAG